MICSDRKLKRQGDRIAREEPKQGWSYSIKGGDPAAPSGTATLLRLSASHESYPRHLAATSGTTHFHRLTGGVYKARERIHRAVADARLLAIPPSRSRVADSDPN